jgi:GDP-L-fucose synthase
MDLTNKVIWITGGDGFFGRHVIKKLQAYGCGKVYASSSDRFDLRNPEDVLHAYSLYEPEIVINLAARVGGIGWNQKNPAVCLYDNLMIGLNMIEGAKNAGVEKFIQVASVCGYPAVSPIPMKEDDLWNGYPEPTNGPYGIAKRTLLKACQAYRQQYGLNAIGLIPINLYGPGDNFDLESSHVIPAMIRKFIKAVKENEDVELWGSGEVSREFLYVEDAAEAIVLAAEQYNGLEPVNLGTGTEIKIWELANLIAEETGYKGHILYNRSKPDGQLRRCLDVSRAKEFGFTAKTDFRTGLRKTTQWYRENYDR